MKKRLTILGLAVGLAAGLAAALLASEAPKYEIALLGRSLDPPAGVDRAMLEETVSRSAGHETAHFLVQLHHIPNAAARAELARRGVELGGYVAGNAWMASVPAAAIRSLADIPEVRWAMPWTAENKLHPRALAGDYGEWTRDRERPGWVMLMVLLHHDVPLERIHGIAEGAGGVAMPPLEILHGGTVWLPEGRIPALADNEDVLWIEEGPMPLAPTNDGVRAGTRSDAVLALPYGLDGSGVNLFVYDGGTVRVRHSAFYLGSGSRVTLIDPGSLVADHATHVAGTAAGSGAGSPGARGRGIATGASVISAAYQQVLSGMAFWDNAGDLEADYAAAREFHQADLATNSIGSKVAHFGYNCSREGDYAASSALIDAIVTGSGTEVREPMISLWSAGNERAASTPKGRCSSNYASTAPPACAKNPIHVGAVNSDGLSMTEFSSWGPCDDGRLKPTVVAPGCETGRVGGETFVYSSLAGHKTHYGGTGYCGTSMSTPAVAGVTALFIQDWRTIQGSAQGQPLPALVKAFLIHTAKDLGQPGPDYIHGYGEVDAQNLIDTLRAGDGAIAHSDDPVVWGTEEIESGEVQNWRSAVPAGTAELRASLAWDDPAAAAFAAYAPVNDLTLQLVGPGGVVHDAFVLDPANPENEAASGLNTVDNQEQVVVKNPAPGRWLVRIKGTSVPDGPQSYGLVYTVEAADHDPETCTTANADFEAGNDLFTLTGASRSVAPAAGHGAFSLQLGGTVSSVHEAYRDFAVPAGATRAVFSYHAYLTTLESFAFGKGFGYDYLTAEVRDLAGNVLAVVDNRSDAWKKGVWMRQFEVDLTPFKGSTVRVVFRAAGDGGNPTTFWVDDLEVETCAP